MIEDVDISKIQNLTDWELDRALDIFQEKYLAARRAYYPMGLLSATEESLTDMSTTLKYLKSCKGAIRAEICRRHPYRANFT